MGQPIGFQEFVALEQIRLLEGDNAAPLPELSPELEFESALVTRGKSLVAENDWANRLTSPDRFYHYLRALCLLLAAVLGLLAVNNALADAQAHRVINIYWLLLVLLAFNTVSLTLWLVGCVAQVSGLIGGTVGNLPLALHRFFSRSGISKQQPEYKAWLQSRFDGDVGMWRISTEAHKLWLLYLLAGLTGLLVLFSVRQYDFVWGSTLLAPSVFVTLTESLSAPMALIGLTPPNATEIIASRSGVSGEVLATMNAEVRRQWAVFLLSSLLFFGVIPRAFCFLISYLKLARHERAYRPDYYLPYYVELRHRQQPFSSESEVVDADDVGPYAELVEAAEARNGFLQVPTDAIRIGIELSSSIAHYVELNVVDRRSLQQALDLLQQTKRDSLTLVVQNNSTADRGIRRRIEQLRAESSEVWLLIHSDSQAPTDDARVQQWYRLAQSVGVPVDNIRHVDLQQSRWAQ